MGRTYKIFHSINTGNEFPIKQAPRRLPIHYQQDVGQLLDEILQQGMLEPSTSPWASPVVLFCKSGTLQFCVDYRKLNSNTKDSYPLPRVDDLMDSLSDACLFSTLDLHSEYWQVEVDSADQEKTAFTMHRGLFQFHVMPFGPCNAMGTFQRLMELFLTCLNWEICIAYIDDIVVFGRSWKEHLQWLQVVLTKLQEAISIIHPWTCQFFSEECSLPWSQHL